MWPAVCECHGGRHQFYECSRLPVPFRPEPMHAVARIPSARRRTGRSHRAQHRAAALAEECRRSAAAAGPSPAGGPVAALSRRDAGRPPHPQSMPGSGCAVFADRASAGRPAVRGGAARPVARRAHRHRHRIVPLHLRRRGPRAPASAARAGRCRRRRRWHRGRRRSAAHRTALRRRQPGARRHRSEWPPAGDAALSLRRRPAGAGGAARRIRRAARRAHRRRGSRRRRQPRSERHCCGARRPRPDAAPHRRRRAHRVGLRRCRGGRPAARHRRIADHRLRHRGPVPAGDRRAHRGAQAADARSRPRRRGRAIRLRPRCAPRIDGRPRRRPR